MHYYQATIPYNETSWLGNLTFRNGDLQLLHGKDGLQLPVRSTTQMFDGMRRKPIPVHYGSVVNALDKADGLWLLLKLDSSASEVMHQQFRQHEYYARPLLDMEHLRVIEVGPHPSWPAAQLKFYRPAAQVDMDAFRPVPKEWVQNAQWQRSATT